MSRRDSRRRGAPPKRARDAVEALLRRGAGADGASDPTLENEAQAGGGDRRAALAAAPRPHRARHLHDRPGRPPATSTTRSRPSARATRSASGSTSPTSPPTSRPARRSTARRAGAPTAPTSRATVEPMLPRALSEDACSLAPGVERLAVTAEIELAGDGAVRSASFYRSRIRSDARLDYDQLDAIFAGRERRARAGRRAARGRAADGGGPGRAARADQPRRRVHRAGVPLRRRRQRRRCPRRRADRVAPPDRAADDPRQRTGRPAARAQAGADDLPGPRPARPGPGRAAGRAAARARDPDPAAAARRSRAQRGGRGRRRGEPPGHPRGRAARARPRGVYIARAPFPEAGPLQRAKQRPRRSRQPRLLSLHLADPPLSRPRRPPGAAGGVGRGGGGAAGGRGARGRRALQRARARVDADRARRRRRLRGLPARARAAAGP